MEMHTYIHMLIHIYSHIIHVCICMRVCLVLLNIGVYVRASEVFNFGLDGFSYSTQSPVIYIVTCSPSSCKGAGHKGKNALYDVTEELDCFH